jgi:5-hydroxyisourate hydrolase-like protein (transthyretin family)
VTQGVDHPVPTISTHVLDTERGGPAVGVHVTLYRLADDGRPLRIAQALTDADGRVRDLLERPLAAGDYRLEFDLAREIAVDAPAHDEPAPATARMGDRPAAPSARPAASGGPSGPERFFRRLTIDVRVTDTGRSYHVPLLLAPYSVTTYRGS